MSSKERSVMLWGGMSVAGGVGLYLLLQLLFAVLVVNGVVAEDRVVILQIMGGVFVGGCVGWASARLLRRSAAAIPAALCVALCVVAAGLLFYGGVVMDGATAMRLLGIFGGGLAADLLIGKGGRKRKAKRVRKA